MKWFRERFLCSFVGLEEIEKAEVSPATKLYLLQNWKSPNQSRAALKRLRFIILELETQYALDEQRNK